MKNYVGKGERITVTGPSGGLSAGDPYVVGNIPCVMCVDVAEGETGAAMTEGIFDLTLEADDLSTTGGLAISAGDIIYYDASKTPKLNVCSTNNVKFGYALEPVGKGLTLLANCKLAG